MPNNNKIGLTIERLCADKKIGSAELARKVGMTSAFLRLVIRGERDMSMSTLRKVARALGVPTAFIVILASGNEQPMAELKVAVEIYMKEHP